MLPMALSTLALSTAHASPIPSCSTLRSNLVRKILSEKQTPALFQAFGSFAKTSVSEKREKILFQDSHHKGK